MKITDREFSDLVSFVYESYGIDLKQKRTLLEGRLSFTINSKGYKSFGEYLQMLKSKSNPNEIQHFLNKITTNYSYFGRELEHFNYLLDIVLPELEKTRSRELRIWSAGCSGGQEAYNIAMLMDHYFGSKKSMWDTTILATDISTDMLKKADSGIYTHQEISSLPSEFKNKYLVKHSPTEFKVCEKIHNEVVFRHGNLMDPFVVKKPFDIIFCRNVMIYFDDHVIERLINKFYDVISDGGYLFIGHSEIINKNKTKFELMQPAIYKRMKKGW